LSVITCWKGKKEGGYPPKCARNIEEDIGFASKMHRNLASVFGRGGKKKGGGKGPRKPFGGTGKGKGGGENAARLKKG